MTLTGGVGGVGGMHGSARPFSRRDTYLFQATYSISQVNSSFMKLQKTIVGSYLKRTTTRTKKKKINKSSLTAAHTPSCFNHIHSNIIDRKFTISLQLPKMFTLNIIRVFYVY